MPWRQPKVDTDSAVLPERDMELTNYQLSLIRHALYHFYTYERDDEGKAFNWLTLWYWVQDHAEKHGRALDYTDKNGTERLRQFVLGVPIRKGSSVYKYPTPKSDLLSSIMDFVLDEDYQLITPEELSEQQPSWRALVRLAEYLKQYPESDDFPKLERLMARYQSVARNDGNTLITILSVNSATPLGLIEVTETAEQYADKIDKRSFLSAYRAEKMLHRRISSGWAVLSPELNLRFYLKNQDNGLNRYYLSLASDISGDNLDDFSCLFLLRHDRLKRLNKKAGIDLDLVEETLRSELAENLCRFTRI